MYEQYYGLRERPFELSPNPRFLSLWLERLPTDRIERQLSPAPAEQAPRVVVRDIKSALRLVAVNEAASKLGLNPGLALADARAMFPAIVVEHADGSAEPQRCLRRHRHARLRA